MPNRIIKESINESKSLAECSIFAQDLYKRLITYADDYGRFNLDELIMLARLYPREQDVVSIEMIDAAIVELVGVQKIGAYRCFARPKDIFGAFPSWDDHQRVRNSKKKIPDPDEEINDWYLRRYVPTSMKIAILERDKCKCQICGKNLNPLGTPVKLLAKFSDGTIHIDHIVPVKKGGRVTYENLRTTCSKCNTTRSSVDEIFDSFETICEIPPQVAANFRTPPPESNPIQSESNPNPNPNPIHAERQNTLPSVDFQAVVDYWNDIVSDLPKVVSLTEQRKKAIKSIWMKAGDSPLWRFATAFRDVQDSDFLSGRNGQWSGCGFDWVLKPANWTKIIEGNYRNKTGKIHAPPQEDIGHYAPDPDWLKAGDD